MELSSFGLGIITQSTPDQWLTFGVMIVSSIVVLYIIKRIILMRLQVLAASSESNIDDFLLEVANIWDWFIVFAIAAFLGSQILTLPSSVRHGLNTMVLILLSWYMVRSIQTVISYLFKRYITKRQALESDFDATILVFMKKAVQAFIWLLAILVIIQNMGYQVSALIGGLGIGGLAVAFAIQNLLGDVFSSISIYFDKPFKLGDFIVIGEDSGTVKKIGIKSTRLQTIQGEELIISNKELTEARVHNYKRMQKRRVAFIVGVNYNTSLKKLKTIPEIVETIIEKEKMAEFSRCHLKTIAASSLDYEIVYHVTSAEYNDFMDTQQSINFAIIEEFDKNAIQIAYPTQTIRIGK